MSNTLPNGKPISRLGLGCSSVWAQAGFTDARAREIVSTALAAGINHFDTGHSYGWGLAEQRLGRFIADRERSSLVISTKIGTFRSANGGLHKDFSVGRLAAALEESLRRMKLKAVDILYLHGPAAADLNDEVFAFFEAEKARGRVTYSGVNSFDDAVIAKTCDTPIDAVMLQYNVLDVSAAPLIAALHERGKIVMAGTILAQAALRRGMFLPTTRTQLWYLARALRNDPRGLLRATRLRPLLDSFGLSTPADMSRFVLAERRIASGLFGTSSPDHVLQTAAAALRPLDDETYARLLEALR